MPSERDRMLAGEFYDSRDPELLAMAHRARALLAQYNASASTEAARRRTLLTELFGAVGEGVWIEPPFHCDYGSQVVIGANSFVNVNCVFLDSATIHIGANTLLGPAVQLLTAFHPLRADERLLPADVDRAGHSPYRRKRRQSASETTCGSAPALS